MSEIYVKFNDVEKMLDDIDPVSYGSMFNYQAHGAVSEVIADIKRDMLPSLVKYTVEERVAKWKSYYDRKANQTSITCTNCQTSKTFEGNKLTTDGVCFEGQSSYCPDCGCKMIETIPWDMHRALIDELKELLDKGGNPFYACFLDRAVKGVDKDTIESWFEAAAEQMSDAELEYEISYYKKR